MCNAIKWGRHNVWAEFDRELTYRAGGTRRNVTLNEAFALWLKCGVHFRFSTVRRPELQGFRCFTTILQSFSIAVLTGKLTRTRTHPSTASLLVAADGRRIFVGTNGNSHPAARSGRRSVAQAGLRPDVVTECAV
jgi:hypothetical protein